MTEFESEQARTTQCSDCSGVVSLRATTCPHCGAPLTQTQRQAKPRLTSTVSAHSSKALTAALVAVVSVLLVLFSGVLSGSGGFLSFVVVAFALVAVYLGIKARKELRSSDDDAGRAAANFGLVAGGVVALVGVLSFLSSAMTGPPLSNLSDSLAVADNLNYGGLIGDCEYRFEEGGDMGPAGQIIRGRGAGQGPNDPMRCASPAVGWEASGLDGVVPYYDICYQSYYGPGDTDIANIPMIVGGNWLIYPKEDDYYTFNTEWPANFDPELAAKKLRGKVTNTLEECPGIPESAKS